MIMRARLIGAATAMLCLVNVLTAFPTYAADLGSTDSTLGTTYSEPIRTHYLRIDAGLAWNDDVSFYQDDLHVNGGDFLDQSIGTQGSVGVGIGWQISQRLRVDLTGEYRIPASIDGHDNLTATLITGEQLQANTRYSGDLSAIVGLANVYFDLGTFGRITPYVGAGAGFSRVEVSHLQTNTVGSLTDPSGSVVTEVSNSRSANNSEWNFAWALMAGFALELDDQIKLDVGYRYIDLGSGTAGASDLLICTCGTIGQQLELSDLTAHEIRVGLRIPLGNREPADAQPLK